MSLTINRRNEIENIANTLLLSVNALQIPISIESLIKSLGFELKVMNFPDDTTTSMIIVNDDAKIENTNTHRLIATCGKLSPERSRFIIAHELGHFMLHKPENEPLFAHRDTEKSRSNNKPEEAEAEFFARVLLMPSIAVEQAIEYFKSNNLKSFDSIFDFTSAIFEVTPSKASIRLTELNLPS